jgi:7-cyano-7-deazaguanine synthase in queuosine biosynthesis
MDVRFRGKSGRAADITSTTEFDLQNSGSVGEQPERLIAPFLREKTNKAGVARAALDLLGEQDVAKTWTCWTGKVQPCGECPACRSRQTALSEARQQHP